MGTQLKKLLLVAAVVILFVLYAVQERPQSLAVDTKTLAAVRTPTPIVRQATPSQTPSSTPTPTLAPPTATGPATTVESTPTPRVLATATASMFPATATSTAEPPTATSTETPSGAYVDGTYTGSEEDAHWGYVTVQVTVANGAVTDVQLLEYPNHRNRSVEINNRALPELIQEAIQAQSAEIDLVSGATDTSRAFVQSLDTALQQAQA